ncbi:MAG: OmpH family outer membrane protein [Alistipes sp.]|jgi:outer membrane protein|nr:OmpH family outer membrane protein [Alistipes sp.]
MKRLILTLALVLSISASALAQNYAVVNSEKVFKSVEKYNAAITQLDELAKQYQAQVDAKFEEVEKLYNAYMQRKASLSQASQQANEENIIKKEQEATEFQESIFGTEGELMKKRLELIQPIQKQVFAAIEEYAKQKGYDMVIDIAQNATMLYYSPKADHTEAIIALLKTKQ